jgi:hypothetical protein
MMVNGDDGERFIRAFGHTAHFAEEHVTGRLNTQTNLPAVSNVRQLPRILRFDTNFDLLKDTVLHAN